ncbi:MAG: ATP synthase F1 subunit gamma [Parcubacteria group bacterium]|nr:ATP synthase F1 subunit gamma [Parcubacteria group bacterium]
MALRDVQLRIRSVRNTAQITKAMEVVSATKMRRSQEIAIAGRPYALAALDMLKNITSRTPVAHPLFLPRETGRTLMVLVTSDKGLAGAFNANVLRLAADWQKTQQEVPAYVAVGKKAREYLQRREAELLRSFSGFGDFISRKDTASLSDFLLEQFRAQPWKKVLLCYTNFRTTLKQEPHISEVLPLQPEALAETIRHILPEYGRYAEEEKGALETRYSYEYRFEPSPEAVLGRLVPTLFAIQLHHIVLESNASEHSARMVAMKNASDNAQELVDKLSVSYNKARQAGITKELTELAAGQEAVQ